MDGRPLDFTQGTWLNPPARETRVPEALTFATSEGTDFWRQTHYGFERASGHALLFEMPPTFAAEITFSAEYRSKYEQAGLLLWNSERSWIKAGVEFADGRANLAVVVTRERSDWSMTPVDLHSGEVTLRLTATGSAVIVHARVAGRWQILRVADFVAPGSRLGPMACSPESRGLEVAFRDFHVGAVSESPLYLED